MWTKEVDSAVKRSGLLLEMIAVAVVKPDPPVVLGYALVKNHKFLQ